MNQFAASITTVLLAIVGVAVIAVLVSKNANTSGVINAGGSAFSQGLGTAISPITGGGGLSFGNGFPGGAGGLQETY